jgi:hypothetical protein
MTKITIKDVFGESKTYSHENLKLWRNGNAVEVYYNKPLDGGRDYRKITLAIAVNPARVDVEEASARKVRAVDPFTAKALENRPDTPEEKALLETYKAIEGKKRRKRRTKAEMEAAKALEGEQNEKG